MVYVVMAEPGCATCSIDVPWDKRRGIMCPDMRGRVCACMRTLDMCGGACSRYPLCHVRVHTDICPDMCADMDIDKRVHICVDMYMGMCIDVRRDVMCA